MELQTCLSRGRHVTCLSRGRQLVSKLFGFHVSSEVLAGGCYAGMETRRTRGYVDTRRYRILAAGCKIASLFFPPAHLHARVRARTDTQLFYICSPSLPRSPSVSLSLYLSVSLPFRHVRVHADACAHVEAGTQGAGGHHLRPPRRSVAAVAGSSRTDI